MTTSDKPVSFKASEGLCYDTGEQKYWDPASLEKEINRSFALCHSCRMCFKYCDLFPVMFDLIDKKDGDITQLAAAEIK